MSCPHTLRPRVTKLPFLGTLDLLPKDMTQCLKITQKVSFLQILRAKRAAFISKEKACLNNA